MAYKVPAFLVILFFAWVLTVNVITVVSTAFKGRGGSFVPLIGGLSGAIGFALTPRLQHLWWIPPLIEPGTVAGLLAVPWIIRESWASSRWNRVALYAGRKAGRQVTLSLFRENQYSIVVREENPHETPVISGMGRSGTWQRHDDNLVLQFGIHEASFQIHREDGRETLLQSKMFADLEVVSLLNFAGIPLVGDSEV